MGFSGGVNDKGPTCQCSVRDAGLIPESGRSPGGGHGNTFQYSACRIPWTEEPGGQRILYSLQDRV